MTIKFKNTFGNRIEKFHSIEPGKVGMYTCGPTVYDFAHIGNYRAYIFEDLLRRWLKYRGYEVTQVMNLTDVDDKTIRESRKAGISLDEYTAKYKAAFFEDLDALGIERAEVYPAATDHIPEMVELVKRLLDVGVAYRGGDGSIYYSIEKFPEYGKLSGKRIDKNIAGARISHDEYDKEQAADFALWKAYEESDGDIFWETELGKGRPGWHIECSAMSMKYLGEHFDIHTGGEDNLFPHHENEVAQSEAATGKKFVNYWMHNAHLIVEGKKMSKSLGNYFTLRQLIDKGYSPLAIRYVLIATHYRQQLNFTFEGLGAAETSLKRIGEFRDMLEELTEGPLHEDASRGLESARETFENCMDDDLNISGALGGLFELIRLCNKLRDDGLLSSLDGERILRFLEDFDCATGLLPAKAESETREIAIEIDSVKMDVETALEQRRKARESKDWPTADAIRDAFAARGLEVRDTPDGPVVKKI
ncbi:cysteine--tRNA ligase [bacterium]|nr:cysteine--tRNA ligase [bacterium]